MNRSDMAPVSRIRGGYKLMSKILRSIKLTIHRFGSGAMPFSPRRVSFHQITCLYRLHICIAPVEKKTVCRLFHSNSQQKHKKMLGVGP